MFIFIDESGLTHIESKQKYFVIAFALMKNRRFAEDLIFEIKDTCQKKGKPIKSREVKYYSLEPLQKEVAVSILNRRYRNYYLCFIDLERAHRAMVDGHHEGVIQKQTIHYLLSSLDANELRGFDSIEIIMDKKLSKKFQEAIKAELRIHLGTKKGIEVRASSSSSERGIQVADLLAGAFRAKLMKKSDLFEVEPSKVFQITIPDMDTYKAEKLK
ncbi:MAG: DUF3800 domain-containing protein [Candidatus Micrarchaeota archaeon]